MNKLALLLTVFALSLPTGAIAQADDEAGPERKLMRDRTERPGERDRQVERDRQGDRQGDHQRPDRQRPGKREPIDVDQLDQAIATLRAMHPQAKLAWLDRIEQLAKDKPQEAAKRLSRYPRLRELMESRENRPAEFELNAQQSRLMREVFPLVHKIRKAEQQEDQDTIDELRPQLRERFEAMLQVRIKLKELEIERLRKHLQRAEQDLDQIKADSDKLIDEKLNDMIERGEGPPGPREEGGRPERTKKPDRSDRE